jgi:hypothetical protein
MKRKKMKKMMIIMAVAVMAGVASAASFSWTSGNGQFYGVDNTGSPTTDLGGGLLTLVYLGTDAGNIDWESATAVTWGNSGMTVTTLNTSTAAGGILYGRASATYGFTFADGDVANGQIYGVMYQDGEGNLSTLRRVSDDSEITTTYTISGLGDNSWSGASYAWAGGVPFYAVPEPTSMALLAFGVAALGLRRKFRA